jgi:ribose 5-phosphate isomerase A
MSSAADPAVLGGVAERAIAEVPRDGSPERPTRIGLGTGRAAEAFILRLAKAVREGLHVVGVPTSERSAELARREGIAVGTLADGPLAVAFDGADEVDPGARLTKGLGAAMLRERVVAAEASRFIVLVTADKLVKKLGERSPLPVEVVPFALASATRHLAKLAARAEQRMVKTGERTGQPVLTDNGNFVVDLYADGAWSDAEALDANVRRIPGVVDTGFFFRMASLVIVGAETGTKTIEPCA